MDAGSSLNLGGVEIFVLFFFFFLLSFYKEACGERVQGNLAHLCGLGYFGSCNPGTSSFLTWSLGEGGQGATGEGGVTHAPLAGLNWVLL